ncbi:hypothetical protein NA78x_003927 [Anatilimnocola sp. NA78]|uniref:hypothetical protein n=1 Tax=Anatilimnocola sp. NA78 TaxID=3415683 RepID=UPI003CE471B0
MNPAVPSARPSRRATSSLEVVVAFLLTSAILTLATPLIVAHNRLLIAQREYRLALSELSNQIERLSLLPPAELPTAIEQLEPSPLATEKLSGAKVAGEVKASDLGQRVTLQITWDEPNRREAPVRLTAWLNGAEDSR